jgi:hypothetical protein
MSARAEMLRDRTIRSKEALGLAGGVEPLYAPLSLTCRLVRILRAIIQIPMLPRFHPREELSLGGSIALQFVGNDHSRYVRQALEPRAKELLRGPLIPAALDHNIQHVPLLTHRPPEIPVLAPDGEKHFIPMPFVARSRTSSTELLAYCWPNLRHHLRMAA